MTLLDDAARSAPELADLRHALHRGPELGLHLPRTQARVLDAIDGLGLEVTAGDGLSSVTAVLRGGGAGPTVLLRADMDALPLLEATDVAFRSEVDGSMHACGHDLHTSMLVGACHLLAARRETLAGDVAFMFQPGEEGFDGAGVMLAEGVLDATGTRPSAAYAIHVFSSTWPHGTFATRPGPLMAAADVITVTVRGAGGHGSAPHRAKDPIPVVCEMVLALEVAMTRTVDPLEPAVLTVGSLHGGNRYNVIPETATFDATLRTFDPEVRQAIFATVRRVCGGVAAAHGVDVEVDIADQYPVTVNTAAEAAHASEVARALFGDERYQELARPITGAEDFSRVVAAVPGAMVFLGACPPGSEGPRPDNHSAHATFDDGVLADGAALYAQLALDHVGATPQRVAGAD